MNDKIPERVRRQANDVGAGERTFGELNGAGDGSGHHVALLFARLQCALDLSQGPRSRLTITLEVVEPDAQRRGARFGGDYCLRGAIDKGRADHDAFCRETRHWHQ